MGRSSTEFIIAKHRSPIPVRAQYGQSVIPVSPVFRSLTNPPNYPRNGGLGPPFASPIEVSRPLAPSVQHVVLAASHPTAVVHSNVRKVAPNAYLKPSNSDEETKAKAIVGLLATGSYTSIFSGKKIPLHPMKRNPLLGGTKTPERPFIERSHAQSKVLLITSGTRLLGAQKNGLIFLQNAVDYLMTETSLASLRARRFESPNLKKTNRNTRLWVRWGNVVGPTILLGLLGLVLRLGVGQHEAPTSNFIGHQYPTGFMVLLRPLTNRGLQHASTSIPQANKAHRNHSGQPA